MRYLSKPAAIPPSATHRRLFVSWLIDEMHAWGIDVPEHWNYAHLRDAVVQWRERLSARP